MTTIEKVLDEALIYGFDEVQKRYILFQNRNGSSYKSLPQQVVNSFLNGNADLFKVHFTLDEKIIKMDCDVDYITLFKNLVNAIAVNQPDFDDKTFDDVVKVRLV